MGAGAWGATWSGRGVRGHELERVAYTNTNVRHTHDIHTGDSQSPENDLFEIRPGL